MKLLECLPLDQYGQGEAKTLDELLDEIESGECQIEWRDKQPVRCVNILVADILTLDAKRYLVEDRQVFSDGRIRERKEKDGSPKRGISEKMHPLEVSQDAVFRALEEELGIEDFGDGSICPACLGIEIEEVESPSYPGLITKYRKHKYQVFLSPDLVMETYKEVQTNKTTYFSWRQS